MRASLSRVLLLICLGLVPARFASAQTQVDLTPFFSQPDEVGDFRIFQSSTGPERRVELIEMAPVGKHKIRFVARSYEAGQLVGIQETFLVPGKKLQFGDIWTENDVTVDLGPPKTWLPLRIAPGTLFRFQGGAKLLYQGRRVGKVKIAGGTTFAGLEPVETPIFTRDETVRLERTLTLTLRAPGVPELMVVSEETQWIAADLGVISDTERTRSYEGGVLVEDTGEIEYWLASGVFGGEPLP